METATEKEGATGTSRNGVEKTSIVGGGIVGLVLALTLHKIGVTVSVYEREPAFHDDVGAGQGMYSNGLRVIRDISPELLERIRKAGFPYVYRRWERHDGTVVAVANENVLSNNDDEIQSIGIRRWRLLKLLYESVIEAGIPVHFHKKLKHVEQRDDLVHVEFEDGSLLKTEILFAADGSKSTVRSIVNPASSLEYTGVTCVMGMAESKPEDRGILFPSSIPPISCRHGCFFPTSEGEQCFQMHYSVKESDSDKGNWGTLSQKVGVAECLKLSEQMKEEGWADKYISPLRQVTHAVRIGFCSLQPPLQKWVYGRIVLLGDAAHPPVPYTGQGSQQGLEDAGTIAMLIEELCLDTNGEFSLENFYETMKLYERIRIPRTIEINAIAKSWGELQWKRANGELYQHSKEEKIKRDVFFHETLPVLIPGSTYNYREAVTAFLKKEPIHLPAVQE